MQEVVPWDGKRDDGTEEEDDMVNGFRIYLEHARNIDTNSSTRKIGLIASGNGNSVIPR